MEHNEAIGSRFWLIIYDQPINFWRYTDIEYEAPTSTPFDQPLQSSYLVTEDSLPLWKLLRRGHGQWWRVASDLIALQRDSACDARFTDLRLTVAAARICDETAYIK